MSEILSMILLVIVWKTKVGEMPQADVASEL